jgi:hypothetical protein
MEEPDDDRGGAQLLFVIVGVAVLVRLLFDLHASGLHGLLLVVLDALRGSHQCQCVDQQRREGLASLRAGADEQQLLDPCHVGLEPLQQPLRVKTHTRA